MALSDILLKLKSVISPKVSSNTRNENVFELHRGDDKSKNNDSEYGDRCVLVGVLRNQKQFELSIRKKFYHIPINQVNECSFPVKYIALYQSKRFFGKNAGIRYVGEVESCTTVKRSKIIEIPKDSNENYLYFKIKKWVLLDKKIKANEMEFTAFSTTRYLLKNARDSAELTLRSRESHTFYNMLVKRVESLVRQNTPDGQDIVFRDFTLKFAGGMIYLYFADVLEYAVGYDVFLEKPTDIIKDIFDYYPEL